MSMNPFEKPELTTAKRILAVQPHYDDNDIAAGGTLASLVEKGAELFYLTVTNDLMGVVDITLTDEAAGEAFEVGTISGRGDCWGRKTVSGLDIQMPGSMITLSLERGLSSTSECFGLILYLPVIPWMVYEAHNDHILTGRATAEAAILFGMHRIQTTPSVDEVFQIAV